MNRSTRNLRIFPLSVIVSLAVLSAFLLFKTTPDSYGQPLPKTYTIYGKGYFENGVWYDIFTDTTIDPTTGKKSYNHAEVAWFNPSAIIPTHIVYDSCSYPVTKVRHGANSASSPDEAWITLSPSLKTCSLTTDKQCSYINTYKGIEKHWIELLWIGNVNVENLDSFFQLEKFCNTFSGSVDRYRQWNAFQYKFTDPQYYPKWKLYLNNVQVQDLEVPENANLNKVKLFNCEGINTLTIPASDTARTTPIAWVPYSSKRSAIQPRKVRFKVDHGYDLDMFYIPADSVELPKAMTVFNGYGRKSIGYCPQPYSHYNVSNVYAIWPPNLEIVNSTIGIDSVLIEDLPKSVRKIQGDFTITSRKTDNTALVPKNIRELGTCSINRVIRNSSGTVYDNRGLNIVIEEDENPLYVSGKITLKAIVKRFEIRRQLIVPDTALTDIFADGKYLDYLLFGHRTEVVPEAACKFGDAYFKGPKYLECEGLIPPNFETENPHILNWCAYTTLIINKQAEEAYRNHPVWGKFLKIETSGVGHVAADKEVVSEKWYSVDGIPLSGPEPGMTNIRVTTYSDGTTSSAKIAVPK